MALVIDMVTAELLVCTIKGLSVESHTQHNRLSLALRDKSPPNKTDGAFVLIRLCCLIVNQGYLFRVAIEEHELGAKKLKDISSSRSPNSSNARPMNSRCI